MPKKLGIRAGVRVALVGAPQEMLPLLEPLPEGVRVLRRLSHELDVILFFTSHRKELDERFDRLRRALTRDGSLWIAWPKRASGVATDLTENVVREVALARGLVDTKVCAIDEVWSGLKLVRRLRDR